MTKLPVPSMEICSQKSYPCVDARLLLRLAVLPSCKSGSVVGVHAYNKFWVHCVSEVDVF